MENWPEYFEGLHVSTGIEYIFCALLMHRLSLVGKKGPLDYALLHETKPKIAISRGFLLEKTSSRFIQPNYSIELKSLKRWV